MKYTAILVDDEQHNNALLNHFIKDYCPEIEVVAMCDGFTEGYKEISKLSPDIVFLDVHLGPNEDSFKLMDILKQSTAQIILVTAREEHAVKAFRYDVTDFILKPIKINELIDAVNKAKNQITLKKVGKDAKEQMRAADLVGKQMEIVTKEGIQFILLTEISYLEALAAHTNIFMENGEVISVNKILLLLDEQLPSPIFSRVHKSYSVNLINVKSVVKNDGYSLELSNDRLVPISRRKKIEIIEHLKRIKRLS